MEKHWGSLRPLLCYDDLERLEPPIGLISGVSRIDNLDQGYLLS